MCRPRAVTDGTGHLSHWHFELRSSLAEACPQLANGTQAHDASKLVIATSDVPMQALSGGDVEALWAMRKPSLSGYFRGGAILSSLGDALPVPHCWCLPIQSAMTGPYTAWIC